jgi:hypothetical protein
MSNDVSYNQLISLQGETVKCQTLLGSHVYDGKLILIDEKNINTTLDGKNIELTGQLKRIREILVIVKERGFIIPEKSVFHYVKNTDEEIVLVRW